MTERQAKDYRQLGVNTPSDVLNLKSRNPAGFMYINALFLWGFITYEKYIEMRAINIAKTMGVIR